MKNKIGVGLIVFSFLYWILVLIMNIPNALSINEDVSRSGRNALVCFSLISAVMLFVGLYLVRRKRK